MLTKRRHPKALPFLFLTEMWERFGFYVVQGMLVLYMASAHGLTDSQSYTIFGVFSALAYIAPMVGGLLADRFLGFKAAILWGAGFLCTGYALLALPTSHDFYIALATIIVGSGLFKPNISSLLGALYAPGDTARDTGFTIFYMGINLGVLFAGISSGFIKDHFGWNAGFALSSIGILIGFAIFLAGLQWGDIKYPPTHIKKKSLFLQTPFLIVYCIAAIPFISLLLQNTLLSKWLLPTIGIFLIFFIFSLALQYQDKARQQLIVLNILIISSVIFWMLYLQMFSSVNLYIDRLIQRETLGITIPTTVFYSIESIFIILLGPFFAWSWHSLSESNKNPSYFSKFFLAILIIGIAMLTLAISTYFTDSSHKISALWIVFSYLLIAIGELLLSPIGLAAVTLLSPSHLTGMMMGIWFVALGFGGQFSGWLAKLSSIPESMTDPVQQLDIYRHAFFSFTYIAFGVAILLFLLKWLLRNRLPE